MELSIDLSPLQLALSALARIGGFLSILHASIRLAEKGLAPENFGAIVFGIAVFLATNNVVALPRFVLGSYLIMFFLVHLRTTPSRKFGAVLLFLAAQLTLFSLMSEIARGDVQRFFETSPVDYLATHGDFDGFQSTATVVQWIASEGFLLGRQIASALLFFVPREYFPEKSIRAGADAAAYSSFPFTNLSAPIPAELYVDFGYPGLIILTTILAICASRLGKYFLRSSLDDRKFRYGLPAIATRYLIILMRGSLVGILGPFLLSFGIAFLFDSFGTLVSVQRERYSLDKSSQNADIGGSS